MLTGVLHLSLLSISLEYSVFQLGMILFPRRYLQLLETFLVVILGAGYITGFWWIQTRGTAERPSEHMAVPTAENDQAHSVNSAELEPSWSRGNQANPPTKKVMI